MFWHRTAICTDCTRTKGTQIHLSDLGTHRPHSLKYKNFLIYAACDITLHVIGVLKLFVLRSKGS